MENKGICFCSKSLCHNDVFSQPALTLYPSRKDGNCAISSVCNAVFLLNFYFEKKNNKKKNQSTKFAKIS